MWYVNQERHLPYFKQLEAKVKLDINTIPEGNPFEIFSLIQPEQIRIVVIGQDPYSTSSIERKGRVDYYDGIAFSSKYTTKVPASLQSLKQLFVNTDIRLGNQVGNVPNDLRYLVNRGVFLGNLAWTVSRNKPNSHMWEEWLTFTMRLVHKLSHYNKDIVFVLLGRKTSILKKYINVESKTLEEIHPAAERYRNTVIDFTASNVLVDASNYVGGMRWTE